MSTLRVTTLQNLSGTEVYTAKAWVNFNGTGTVAIRSSGNVSSISDNGTGDYTVNFTTALADANYVVAGVCGVQPAGSGWGDINIRDANQAPSTTSVRIGTIGYLEWQDTTIVGIVVFR